MASDLFNDWGLPTLSQVEKDVLMAVMGGYNTPDLTSVVTHHDRRDVEQALRRMRQLGFLKGADE